MLLHIVKRWFCPARTDGEPCGCRSGERTAIHAECLEMMVASCSQGFAECPTWIVAELEARDGPDRFLQARTGARHDEQFL